MFVLVYMFVCTCLNMCFCGGVSMCFSVYSSLCVGDPSMICGDEDELDNLLKNQFSIMAFVKRNGFVQ